MSLPRLEVHSRELANGATVLVHPDFSAPVVSIQFWVGTGSIHENEWLGSGVSHLLEHLMFKGTPTRGNSQMAQEIQLLGGHLNAYTSFDRTVYYADLPSDHAVAAMDILTDAVLHSTLPEDEFEKEKEVIRREFAMGDDSPERRLSKLIFRTAYSRHPYRFPVIGHLDLFNRLTRENVLSYYHERYSPQNITLVVAGAVEPEAIFAAAEKGLGNETRRFMRDVPVLAEPTPQGRRTGFDTFPSAVTRLALLFPMPGFDHPDVPALDLLAVIAGGGRSSRLFQACVEQSDLAEETEAFAFAGNGTGLWGVEGRCQPEKRHLLLARWEEETRLLAEECVSETELSRAKRQSLLQHVNGLKTMSGKAGLIGRGWLQAREVNFELDYLNRLQELTAEDLRAAAARYLPARHVIITELAPPPSGPTTVRLSHAEEESAVVHEKIAGLSVFTRKDHRLPLVSFRAIFPGGPLTEPTELAGLSRLASQLLIKGTQRRTSAELAGDIESLGGSLGADSGNNTGTLALEVLSSEATAGLDLFLEIMREPMLRPEELETERRKQLAQIEVEKDHPMAVARDLVRGLLYPDHAYGRNLLGTAETLERITPADIEQHWHRSFYQQSLRFAAAGDFHHHDWITPVQPVLKECAARPAPAAPQIRATTLREIARRESFVDKSQAVLQVAFPTAPLIDPTQPSLDLLSEALSDLGSRLFIRIREELGLAYFVGATQFLGQEAGHFVFYLGTDPAKRAAVETAFLEEIARIGETGITAPELERARAKIISDDKIAAQQTASTVYHAALNELLGLGWDHRERRLEQIASLSLEEVNATAKTYFHAKPYALVVVSPV
jgi:zinc protease